MGKIEELVLEFQEIFREANAKQRRKADEKRLIVGKWETGTGGHHVYEFFDTGIVQIYTTLDRSRDIMGKYLTVDESLLRLSTPVSDNTLEFSVSENTLNLYPADGGSPIRFERA